MRQKLLAISLTGCLTFLLAGCSSEICGYGGCYNGRYSYTTDAKTAPSICNSACPDPCDDTCKNDNFNYRGCGDNCVLP